MNTWFISDGYVPYIKDSGDAPIGHEAIAVVNKGDRPARLQVEVYFMNREPMRGFEFEILPERSHRIILGKDYELAGSMKIPVPSNEPYSLKLTSDGDLSVQFSRVDSRSQKLALFSTVIPKET